MIHVPIPDSVCLEGSAVLKSTGLTTFQRIGYKYLPLPLVLKMHTTRCIAHYSAATAIGFIVMIIITCTRLYKVQKKKGKQWFLSNLYFPYPLFFPIRLFCGLLRVMTTVHTKLRPRGVFISNFQYIKSGSIKLFTTDDGYILYLQGDTLV